MQAWIASFKEIGVELGLSADEADKKALQTLIDIQGSLIVTSGLNDLKIFEDSLQKIENSYVNK